MNIKEARNKIGISQQQMSELMDIPKRTIENWESGKSNPPPYVERLVVKELLSIGEEFRMKKSADIEKAKNALEEDGINTYLISQMTDDELLQSLSYTNYDEYNDFMNYLAHKYDI